MRASVTRYLILKELDTSGHEADVLLEMVDGICDQNNEDVEDYLWRALDQAEYPISDPDDLQLAVEILVAEDLRMEPEELREILRRSRPD